MTKFLTRVLSIAMLLGVTAGAASAAQWPNATYPDTLNLFKVQFGMANPGAGNPALLDTVNGVGGIITGFDAKATGYAFYIQSTGGNPWTGIDVFTGSFNYNAAPFSLAIGDSVIVYGRIQEFGGGTEIEGLDGVQGTNDITVRKIGGGFTVPPFHGGTTTQLKEVPKGTVLMEQWEGLLVQIDGPLRVARNTGVGTNSFLLVSDAAPSDSVNIDGNTLTTYAAPANGTVVDMVRGIYEERTRGYRIQIRDGNDIVLATPPNVTDAYPVADNQIRVVFDRNVTSASATNTNNYSLGSFGSVDAAVMDGTSASLITVTNGLGHGDNESVTVSNIAGLANGLVMTTGQTRNFINGVLTCAEVQAPNADSLAGVVCLDRSRFAGGGGQTSQGNLGPRMSMTGVVTGSFTPLHYLQDEGGGARSGVSIFAPPTLPIVGHKLFVTGQVQEFFGESEVSSIVASSDLGAVTPIAAVTPDLSAIDHDGCDVAQALDDAEDYEGMLVKIPYGRVILAEGLVTPPTNGFHISNLSGTPFSDSIFVSNLNGVLNPFTSPSLGQFVQVTGVLHYSNNSFRICPRGPSDIQFLPLANRRVVDLMFTRLGNGRTSVNVRWKGELTPPAPTADLSSKVIIRVDGVPVDTIPQTAFFSTQTGPGTCDVIPCDTYGCGALQTGDPSGPLLGSCSISTATSNCACGSNFVCGSSLLLARGQLVSAQIVPAPGATPETYGSDDVVSTVFRPASFASARLMEAFAERCDNAHTKLLGVDPAHIGDPAAVPTEVAEFRDSSAAFSSISLVPVAPQLQTIGAQPVRVESWNTFWKVVGKACTVAGYTAGGVVGGAAVGTITLPVVGSVSGAVVGGVGGALVGVGDAIDKNVSSVASNKPHDSNLVASLTTVGPFGTVDIKRSIDHAILSDPGRSALTLCGGGLLIEPSMDLIAGSFMTDSVGASRPSALIDIGLLDADGSLETYDDRLVVLTVADSVLGIRRSDIAHVNLSKLGIADSVTHGAVVKSVGAFIVSTANNPTLDVHDPTAGPTGMWLAASSPNPARNATSIRFSLAQPSRVTLKVYDLVGREVAVLFDDTSLEAGEHAATLSAQALPPGVYMYGLRTGSTLLSRKLIIVR